MGYHGKGSWFIAQFWAVSVSELVRDRSTAIASDLAHTWNLIGCVRLWSPSASATIVRISGVGASKLVHEVGDNTVEVQAIVETILGKVNEVICCTTNKNKAYARERVGGKNRDTATDKEAMWKGFVTYRQ